MVTPTPSSASATTAAMVAERGETLTRRATATTTPVLESEAEEPSQNTRL
jgi:hypothetical protein